MTKKEGSNIPEYKYPSDGSRYSSQKFDLIDQNGSFIEPEFVKITNGEPQIEQILKTFYKDLLTELNSLYSQFTKKNESGLKIILPRSLYFESELDGTPYFTTVINPLINWSLKGIENIPKSPLSLGYIDFTMDFKSDKILIDSGVCTPPTMINTYSKNIGKTDGSQYTTGWNAGVFMTPDLTAPTSGFEASYSKSKGFSYGTSQLQLDTTHLLRIFKHDVFHSRLCLNAPIGHSHPDATGNGSMQVSIAINGTDMNVVKQKKIISDIYIQPYLKINEYWLLDFIENWKNEDLRVQLNFKPNKLNRFLKVWLVLSNLIKGEIKAKRHNPGKWLDMTGFAIKGGRTSLNEVVLQTTSPFFGGSSPFKLQMISKEFEYKFPRNILLPLEFKEDVNKAQNYDLGIPSNYEFLWHHINDDKEVSTAFPYWWHEHIDDSKQMSELLTHIPCVPIVLKDVPHGIS